MQSRDVPISEGPSGTFCGLSAPADGILFYWGSPPTSHPQILYLKCLNYDWKMLREQEEESKAMPSCLVFNSTPSSSFSGLVLLKNYLGTWKISSHVPARKFRLYFLSPTQILLTHLAHPEQYWKGSQQKSQD